MTFPWDLWTAGCVTVLGLGLIALAVVDLKTGFLPDWIQAVLAVAGLGAAVVGSPIGVTWVWALAGAALNGAVFWGLRWLVTRWKGREAMGFGDVKLVAVGGLWLGPWALPYIMAAGGVLTLLGAGLVAAATRKPVWRGVMPLGPGLAIGIFACFLAGLFHIPGFLASAL